MWATSRNTPRCSSGAQDPMAAPSRAPAAALLEHSANLSGGKRPGCAVGPGTGEAAAVADPSERNPGKQLGAGLVVADAGARSGSGGGDRASARRGGAESLAAPGTHPG